MTTTPNLALPYIEAAQAQKHVTHNEALALIDALAQLAVLDRDLATPPVSPSGGQRYIVAASPTGAWAGHASQIATWIDGAWAFTAPGAGFLAYVADEAIVTVWTGSAWVDLATTITALHNLERLGLGTTADATNPFAAKLNNALWVAKTAAEGGDGNLRYKLSKESAAKTLSLLFQDNFSGRAEIGLAGDDDFHFKVSPDGSTWIEALKLDRASGKVSFPAFGGPREALQADRTYYVRSDGNDANSGLSNSAGGAFATFQRAIDVVQQTLDLAGHKTTIQAGGASGTFTGQVLVNGPFVGAKTRDAVKLKGDTTTPGNFVLQTTSGAGNHVLYLYEQASIAIEGFKLQSSGGSGQDLIRAFYGSHVVVSGKMEFGAATGNHMTAARLCTVDFAAAAYTISGGAAVHWASNHNCNVNAQSITITLSGTPNFSVAFATCNAGTLIALVNTFSGSATGKQYDVQRCGAIQSGGATLPGDVAGTISSGGQYT